MRGCCAIPGTSASTHMSPQDCCLPHDKLYQISKLTLSFHGMTNISIFHYLTIVISSKVELQALNKLMTWKRFLKYKVLAERPCVVQENPPKEYAKS